MEGRKACRVESIDRDSRYSLEAPRMCDGEVGAWSAATVRWKYTGVVRGVCFDAAAVQQQYTGVWW